MKKYSIRDLYFISQKDESEVNFNEKERENLIKRIVENPSVKEYSSYDTKEELEELNNKWLAKEVCNAERSYSNA